MTDQPLTEDDLAQIEARCAAYRLPAPIRPIRELDPMLASALAAQGYDPEVARQLINDGIIARQQAASAEDGDG